MASAGQRLLGFGDATFTETDQDANSALTELDKGLRSGRLGEQCETIVRFPRLFEKYPFPILINSACLKLAEVFRGGQQLSTHAGAQGGAAERAAPRQGAQYR
ncbi:hypothetical protein MRX96_044848 [Rhipicephalus microplus]